MRCNGARLLTAPHILGDPTLTQTERVGLERHVRRCPACAREYAEVARVVALLRAIRNGEGKDSVARQSVAAGGSPASANDGQGQKTDTAYVAIRPPIHHNASPLRCAPKTTTVRLLRAAGRIAACLAILTGAATGMWKLSGDSATSQRAGGVAGRAAPASPAVMGVVADLRPDGRPMHIRPLIAREQVLAETGQHVRVEIWDRHEITMEPTARLAVDRREDDGCVVTLSSGRITACVHRAEGEGAFRVVTAQAEVTVTGTVFTVTAGPDRTQLSVLEGTVALSARQGPAQRVSAGRTFTTDGQTLVQLEHTPETLGPAVAGLGAPIRDPVDLLQCSPAYRARFAPLLALGAHLKARGVDVDERALLAISGDLWAVQYPKDAKAGVRPFVHRRAGLERAARLYGYQVRWLAPANERQAARIIRDALAAGDQLLAYGAGEHGVLTVGWDNAEVFNASSVLQPYRFLGEAQPTQAVLARITPSSSPQKPREQLAREAMADIRQLLTATTDPDYWVGRDAVEAWANAAGASEQRIVPQDPMFQALHVIAKLAVPCHHWYVSAGAACDVSSVRSLAQHLDNSASLMFQPTPSKGAGCDAAAHDERQGLTRAFAVAVRAIAVDARR